MYGYRTESRAQQERVMVGIYYERNWLVTHIQYDYPGVIKNNGRSNNEVLLADCMTEFQQVSTKRPKSSNC